MQTPRYELPLLASAQAHKELTHNEALLLVDFLLHPVAEAMLASPPSGLVLGDAGKCWIVAPSAVGEWFERDKMIACWTGNDWRFSAVVPGMTVHLVSLGLSVFFANEQWVIPPAVPIPAGGTTIDTEARGAIEGLLALLRERGILAD